MAFTGAAVFKVISGNKVRITGLSLAAAAAGTISLHNGNGEVKLPASCKWDAFKNGEGHQVLPLEAIQASFQKVAADTHSVVVSQGKAGAAVDGSDFLVTLTNSDAANPCPGLEIYLEYLL